MARSREDRDLYDLAESIRTADTLLVLSNLPDRDMLIMVAAGWHMHLDTLVDRGTAAADELFDEAEGYLRWVADLAAEGAAAGLTPLEVAREAAPGPYAHLLDPERTVGNLHRAYAELESGALGRPLDVAAVFGEMVRFNDGVLPTCLA